MLMWCNEILCVSFMMLIIDSMTIIEKKTLFVDWNWISSTTTQLVTQPTFDDEVIHQVCLFFTVITSPLVNSFQSLVFVEQ